MLPFPPPALREWEMLETKQKQEFYSIISPSSACDFHSARIHTFICIPCLFPVFSAFALFPDFPCVCILAFYVTCTHRLKWNSLYFNAVPDASFCSKAINYIFHTSEKHTLHSDNTLLCSTRHMHTVVGARRKWKRQQTYLRTITTWQFSSFPSFVILYLFALRQNRIQSFFVMPDESKMPKGKT